MKLTISYCQTLIILALIASAYACDAGQFTTLYTFHGPDGSSPQGSMTQDADGNFWGITAQGGMETNVPHPGPYWSGNGTVFRMTHAGILSSFALDYTSGTNGWEIFTGMLASDGNFYATPQWGPTFTNYGNGWGTVIKVTPLGIITTIHSFTGTDGINPNGLVEGIDGALYGVTGYGGPNFSGFPGGNGSVFRITTNGLFSTLLYFDGTNGAVPSSSLLLGKDGNLYGTTFYGGDSFESLYSNSGHGTIFKLTTNGVLTPLIRFDGTNGAYPNSKLVLATDGAMYGITQAGNGTIFRFATNQEFTTLYTFTGGSDGYRPVCLLQATDGNFYGVTFDGGSAPLFGGFGTLFKMTPEGNLTTLHTFTGGADGATPSGLMQARDENLYGVTDGFSSFGATQGTIFRYLLRSEPRFESASRTNNTFAFSWSAEVGSSYQVQFSSNPSSTNWNNLGNPITATNSPMSGSDAIGTNSQRYYRIVVLP